MGSGLKAGNLIEPETRKKSWVPISACNALQVVQFITIFAQL